MKNFNFQAEEAKSSFMVRIDNREQKRAKLFKSMFENYYNCSCTIEQLPIGDYIFNNDVVFEYKTASDFISSITSKRVFNQALDQYNNFKHHFVIIVGSSKEFKDEIQKLFWIGVKFNSKQLYGAIARLNTFTNVIRVNNEEEAMDYMIIQARKCLDGKVLHKELSVKTANPAYNYLISSVKGLGAKTTQSIIDECNVYSLKDLLSLNKEKLTAIDGIGNKTAEIILKATVGE